MGIRRKAAPVVGVLAATTLVASCSNTGSNTAERDAWREAANASVRTRNAVCIQITREMRRRRALDYLDDPQGRQICPILWGRPEVAVGSFSGPDQTPPTAADTG
jgi:hypothetical protein